MFRNKKWCNTRGQNTRRPDAQHAFWIPQRNAHEKVHRCMQICLFWIDQAKANNIRHVGPSQKQREHNFAKLVGPCAKEPLHNMNNIRHVGPCAEEPLHVFGCFVLSSFRLLPPSCVYPSQQLVARIWLFFVSSQTFFRLSGGAGGDKLPPNPWSPAKIVGHLHLHETLGMEHLA